MRHLEGGAVPVGFPTGSATSPDVVPGLRPVRLRRVARHEAGLVRATAGRLPARVTPEAVEAKPVKPRKRTAAGERVREEVAKMGSPVLGGVPTAPVTERVEVPRSAITWQVTKAPTPIAGSPTPSVPALLRVITAPNVAPISEAPRAQAPPPQMRLRPLSQTLRAAAVTVPASTLHTRRLTPIP